MLLLNLLVLLLVVNDLLKQEIFVVFLGRVLNLELSLAFSQFSVLFVESLRHVRHRFQVVVEGVLADARILIVLLLFESVRHQLLSVRSERIVKFLPHFVLFVGEALRCPLLQNADLFLEVVHKFMNLIDCFLLGRPLSTVHNVGVRVVGLLIFLELLIGHRMDDGCRVVQSCSNYDVFHLFLIVTFIPGALQWLLADPVNLVLHVLDDLAILLLPENVILLLGTLGLLELFRTLVLLQVNLIVLLVQIRPILSRHLQSYKTPRTSSYK